MQATETRTVQVPVQRQVTPPSDDGHGHEHPATHPHPDTWTHHPGTDSLDTHRGQTSRLTLGPATGHLGALSPFAGLAAPIQAVGAALHHASSLPSAVTDGAKADLVATGAINLINKAATRVQATTEGETPRADRATGVSDKASTALGAPLNAYTTAKGVIELAHGDLGNGTRDVTVGGIGLVQNSVDGAKHLRTLAGRLSGTSAAVDEGAATGGSVVEEATAGKAAKFLGKTAVTAARTAAALKGGQLDTAALGAKDAIQAAQDAKGAVAFVAKKAGHVEDVAKVGETLKAVEAGDAGKAELVKAVAETGKAGTALGAVGRVGLTAAKFAGPVGVAVNGVMAGLTLEQGIRHHDTEKIAVGGAMTAGTGLEAAGLICDATGVGAPVGLALNVAGGAVILGAMAWQSRKAIVNTARNAAHAVVGAAKSVGHAIGSAISSIF